MMDIQKRLLFKLIIHNANSGQETEYTILDENPSFASLSAREKKHFIDIQQQKIKKLISQKYQPGYQKVTS
jgi:hypothetical protein